MLGCQTLEFLIKSSCFLFLSLYFYLLFLFYFLAILLVFFFPFFFKYFSVSFFFFFFQSLNCTNTWLFVCKALVWFILSACRWTFFTTSSLEADFYLQNSKFNSQRRITKISIVSVSKDSFLVNLPFKTILLTSA